MQAELKRLERALRILRARDDALRWWRWLRTALLPLLFALLSLAGFTAAAPAAPAWFDATGRPNASARDALRLLADAADDGLAPRLPGR